MAAWVGIALRYFDLIILRGALSYASATEFRLESAPTEDVSALQLVGTLLSSLALLPLVLMLVDPVRMRQATRLEKLSAVALSAAWMSYGALLGGRSTLTVGAAVLLMAWTLGRRRSNARLRPRQLVKAAIAVVIAALVLLQLSASLLVDRLTIQGGVVSGLRTLEQRRGLELQNNFITGAETQSSLERKYVAISVVHYVLHGPHEFNELVRYRTEVERHPTWGATTFAPAARVLGLVSNVKPADRREEFPAASVFTTFMGPVFVDFGAAGALLFASLYGYWAGSLWRRLRDDDDLMSGAVYCVVAASLVHAPALSILESAVGLFPLVAFVLARFLSRRS